LRNGSSASGGAGSEILYCNHIVYVFGQDLQWWRWSNGWIPNGSVDPCGGAAPNPTAASTTFEWFDLMSSLWATYSAFY
jgi:hypothetical protein